MIAAVQNLTEHKEDFPPAHDIVTYPVLIWNKCKGGQDMVSWVLKNIKERMESTTGNDDHH
eukprot:12697499-Ditylum_brightwellii.AAC.1